MGEWKCLQEKLRVKEAKVGWQQQWPSVRGSSLQTVQKWHNNAMKYELYL